jgi:hypothetical protein
LSLASFSDLASSQLNMAAAALAVTSFVMQNYAKMNNVLRSFFTTYKFAVDEARLALWIDELVQMAFGAGDRQELGLAESPSAKILAVCLEPIAVPSDPAVATLKYELKGFAPVLFPLFETLEQQGVSGTSSPLRTDSSGSIATQESTQSSEEPGGEDELQDIGGRRSSGKRSGGADPELQASRRGVARNLINGQSFAGDHTYTNSNIAVIHATQPAEQQQSSFSGFAEAPIRAEINA